MKLYNALINIVWPGLIMVGLSAAGRKGHPGGGHAMRQHMRQHQAAVQATSGVKMHRRGGHRLNPEQRIAHHQDIITKVSALSAEQLNAIITSLPQLVPELAMRADVEKIFRKTVQPQTELVRGAWRTAGFIVQNLPAVPTKTPQPSVQPVPMGIQPTIAISVPSGHKKGIGRGRFHKHHFRGRKFQRLAALHKAVTEIVITLPAAPLITASSSAKDAALAKYAQVIVDIERDMDALEKEMDSVFNK